MPKFFVNPESISENRIVITGSDAKHIGAVLRMKKNEKLIVCNGQNIDYDCIIKDISKEAVELEVIERQRNSIEPKIKVRLYQSLPKSDKMDFIVQKCVELGVDEIVPMITDYTVSKVDDLKRFEKKLERWNKISESASKQCMRGKIPSVLNIVSFSEAVKSIFDLDRAIIPYEKESSKSLRSSISGFDGKSIAVFIGPEGGFSDCEIQMAVDNKIEPVTLGNRILRTETAGMVVLANIMYELGDE